VHYYTFVKGINIKKEKLDLRLVDFKFCKMLTGHSDCYCYDGKYYCIRLPVFRKNCAVIFEYVMKKKIFISTFNLNFLYLTVYILTYKGSV
jgi:hypothetical protein